jgi:hypothetical protein
LSTIVDPNERRQFIGNAIYPQIAASINETFAGKITGMLLDETVVETDKLLKDQ